MIGDTRTMAPAEVLLSMSSGPLLYTAIFLLALFYTSFYFFSPALSRKNVALHRHHHRRRALLGCLPSVRWTVANLPVCAYAHVRLALQEGGWRHRLRSGLPEHHYQAWR